MAFSPERTEGVSQWRARAMAGALLQGGFVFKLDRATCAHYALPRQGAAFAMEELRYMTVIERIPGGGRNLTVRRHLAAGNLADGFAEGRIALLALHFNSAYRKQPTR